MWRSDDIVEEKRHSMPSEAFLQQPEFQDDHSDEAVLHSILEPEGGEIERTDEKMDCKDKQNPQLFQNASQPVSQNVANHNQACQASDFEHAGMIKQDYRTDLPLNDTKADLDPGTKLQGELPCPRCERKFMSSQGLQRHIQTHALSTCHTQRFKCNRCRRTFSTLFSRRRHEKRHENRNKKINDHTIATCTASQNVPGNGEPLKTASQNPQPNKCINAADGEQKDDKNSDFKASHICKYCKKAFRTHTCLRRHQRRIHERQLLSRGVYKKIKITQVPEGQQHVETDSQTANPQCAEDIDKEKEYMVDISSNISENLSFYIDGKIVSTSAVSNCEVIEMNSGGSAVIGLNAVIISPAQITQALKLETSNSSFNPDLSGQSSTRRRTSTPPLLPQIKTELESESILSTSSSSLSSLTLSSTSGAPLVTAHLPQCIETVAFHKEKTVYLSPKLKQLLQNQDGSKQPFALIADGHKLGPPLSLTVLPATTTRFKRRTTSPPSSQQQTPDLNVEKQDQDSTKAKMSKLESHELSILGTEETEPINLPINSSDGAQMQQQILPLDCSVSRTGGNSCNQQPLDLSNSVGKRDSSDSLAESILDLSISGKSLDCDSAGVYLTQPALRKNKPNSIMLQKVLMNEYGGVDNPSVEDSDAAGVVSAPDLTNLAVMPVSDASPPNPERLLFELSLPPASIHSTPPLLSPVTIHPAASVSPSHGSPSSSPTFVSFLSTPTVEPNQDIQTLHSTFLVSDTVPPTGSVEDCADNPVHLSQGDLKMTIPDWVSSAPGGLESLIPAAPSLSLQGPHWLTDPAICELAQRTLVVDSVLASDTQIFSPSLPINQSNITSLTFPPNTVVIEYTVALQSTENIPALQANPVQCLSDKIPVDALQQEPYVQSEPQPLSQDTTLLSEPPTQSAPIEELSSSTDDTPTLVASTSDVKVESKEEEQEQEQDNAQSSDCSKQENTIEDELTPLHPFCKNFMCNVCEEPFQSMKILSQHVGEHSKEWPYKCEFCVQLFKSDTGLLEHRSSYHGIGKIYVCKTCSKEFAFLCNLEQHQRDLHPGQECSHTEVVHGKLRPENHNSPKTDMTDPGLPIEEIKQESDNTTSKAEEDALDNTSEELFTTIKIMASGGVKQKGPDVRLGINQHYPSFKPPPFPYHNRTPTGTTAASATNFTTHNIPQTFSTAIRCTKCGKSFDNMPELHKHILACANASDKKRYTPKKNPIPLKQFAKAQNGVLSPARIVNSRQNFSQKVGQPKKLIFHESPVKIKMSVLNKKKSQLVQRGRPAGGRRAFAQDDLDVFACPHCSREFTYNASLKKHVAFSCPMRPTSRNSKKRTLSIVSAQENNGSLRRQIANMSAKPQGSNHGPKTISKSQIIKQNAAVDTTQDFRLKRSSILSTSVVQSNKKGKPILNSSFMPQMDSKQIVLSSVAQVNSQEPGVRVHVLGRKMEQRVGDVKLQPRRDDRLSLRLRERVGGPITRSVQQASTTTTVLKQPDSHNIVMHPVILQIKK
ncbi:PR domain zinc finger protein 2 isoform X2 [Megalobrama amblycephala]|uniref:PR domain zinc finger protein 2 isoform X2 n=1 Tax=Megalobrama amblycephala TaxID=75352 RepID=UPI0020143317|nr:PR domain zinc finger protein 2 isoform X2 [Megalobrama amblycephala]XP_048065768.1 PR domain zinc finger protein 2 isoform X2 [Megalobrama amblycephala]XP_048065769.1 PR domain zinc finger protein 2 isoform X2 [Megalobrama amblycephala]XP_048065770.1 PR domain zinc finger protein 2 isoform X2 [Megalobrama amblycephala]